MCDPWYFPFESGSHKDHEVKLIKKAISQVKGEYMEMVGKINEAQGSMGKLK